MHTGYTLSLTLTPPIHVPMRFFFSAPLFALIACMVILVEGPDALISRWRLETLAVTHMLAVGYVAMVIVGALFQLLPVLIGSPMQNPVRTANLVHPSLFLGVCCLVLGFLFGYMPLLKIAMAVLAFGFLIFLFTAIRCLLHAPLHREYIVAGMLFGLVALLETVAMGLRLTGNRTLLVTDITPQSWTDIHFAFGLLGWIGTVLMSVAIVVVPMFQLTPPYPEWSKRVLPSLLLLCIAFWAMNHMAGYELGPLRHYLDTMFALMIGFCLLAFAVTTLILQSKRTANDWDVTVHYWRLAMGMLIVAILLWLGAQFSPALQHWTRLEHLLGAFYIIGFAISAINGMLHKIVPFLVWLHLQNINSKFVEIPKMKDVIPLGRQKRQFWLHTITVASVLLAVVYPTVFIYPAAILFMLSTLHLYYNLTRALLRYKKIKQELLANTVS